MNLCDRGCRNRRIEAREELAIGRPSEAFDGSAGKGFGEGRHPVLQAGEIVGNLGADHIGPGGEKLAELDPGRAQALHGAGEPVGALGAFRAALGEQPRNTMGEARRAGQILGGERGNHALAHENEARAHRRR
jgi:hypothetical protein